VEWKITTTSGDVRVKAARSVPDTDASDEDLEPFALGAHRAITVHRLRPGIIGTDLKSQHRGDLPQKGALWASA
jgi:hypothetical protein